MQQFTNGAANLTYLLHFGDRAVVLRRPPSGTIAPGAHDMKREWRVLSRLWRRFDRAPRAHLFCDDHAIAGADCFVMEHRPGVVIRGEIPAPMARHADVARRASFALVDAMAELHLLDPDRAELGDLGKPAGFVARQVNGWRKRWELAEARSSPDLRGVMAAIGARLERAVPAPQRASIVHNDLKLDNCAFDPADPDRASAIFDWDMTTLGDPLVDLGTLLNYWPDPADPPDVRRGSHDGMRHMGLPARAEITARYVARTGPRPGAHPLVRGVRPVEDGGGGAATAQSVARRRVGRSPPRAHRRIRPRAGRVGDRAARPVTWGARDGPPSPRAPRPGGAVPLRDGRSSHRGHCAGSPAAARRTFCPVLRLRTSARSGFPIFFPMNTVGIRVATGASLSVGGRR